MPAPARQPISNRIVLAVLRSPCHRLLSGSTLELTLRGQRTGRVFSLPVQYARHGDRLVVLPAHAERKRWWRNLTTAAPVSVQLARHDRAGQARVVRAGTLAFDSAATAYVRRFPKAARLVAASPILVAIDLTPAGRSGAPSVPTRPEHQAG